MKLRVASNFEFILDHFDFEKSKRQEKQGFVLEGGSGAGKSWDIIQFLMYYCQTYEDSNKDILIFRATYADCKKTVLKDFIKVLKLYELYDDKLHSKSHPQNYNLFGNIIYFSGLDSMGSHGERHDIIWGNEGMELDFDAFKQLNQRCNEAFFIDYNPAFTIHWIFDKIIPRPDTHFFKSTQLDNPFLPAGQRSEILAYEPWLPGSYEIRGNDIFHNGQPIGKGNIPPAHPENIQNGTADEFMWKVYGLGLRGAQEGLIFRNVEYIEEFPEHLAHIYGTDFGFTNDPTAVVRYAEDSRNIYAELLIYEPIDNPEDLSGALEAVGVEKNVINISDSADKYVSETKGAVQMVLNLREMGWEIQKVSKTKGITYWLSSMKKKKLCVVKNRLSHHYRRELENYKWKSINGIPINQPIDGFDHAISATRYDHMAHNQGSEIETDWS